MENVQNVVGISTRVKITGIAQTIRMDVILHFSRTLKDLMMLLH